MAIILYETEYDRKYEGDGYTMEIVYGQPLIDDDGVSFPADGQWVLKDPSGAVLGVDFFRRYLVERIGGFELINIKDQDTVE
mgnify:CR=1 FL=1